MALEEAAASKEVVSIFMLGFGYTFLDLDRWLVQKS